MAVTLLGKPLDKSQQVNSETTQQPFCGYVETPWLAVSISGHGDGTSQQAAAQKRNYPEYNVVGRSLSNMRQVCVHVCFRFQAIELLDGAAGVAPCSNDCCSSQYGYLPSAGQLLVGAAADAGAAAVCGARRPRCCAGTVFWLQSFRRESAVHPVHLAVATVRSARRPRRHPGETDPLGVLFTFQCSVCHCRF